MRHSKKNIVRRKVSDAQVQWPEGVPEVLKRVLLARGITDDALMDLSMAKMMPPSLMKSAEAAARILASALESQDLITIVGDYDCDGATSTALTVTAIRGFGHQNINYLIPNRFDDGYGLSAPIVRRAAELGAKLIMTVDNGISSIEGVAEAKRLGLQVVITDHHLPGKTLPDADAIVNPNQEGCDFSCKSTAGVGVAFYLMCALRQQLRTSGWFSSKSISEFNMASLLDLVALGTVADVVALEYNNRVLVAQGLKRIRKGHCRPGIVALAKIANRELCHLSSADLGFALGPRLNAAGRLDDMSIGIECLIAESDSRAQELALLLNSYNEERKVIEADMQEQAKAFVQKIELAPNQKLPWGVSLFDECWHQGVVGLLASRIKEQYHRPVVAFAPASDESGELKGSARSIAGLHIRDAFERVASQNPGLIIKFGGHAAAAGLSIDRKNYDQFAAAFDQAVRAMMSEDDLKPQLLTDGDIADQELTLQTAKKIAELGPWGQGFPEPLFDGRFTVYDKRLVGSKHLKMILTTPSGSMVDAIQFNSDWVEGGLPQQIRVVYKMDINRFRGKESLQLIVDYME